MYLLEIWVGALLGPKGKTQTHRIIYKVKVDIFKDPCEKGR